MVLLTAVPLRVRLVVETVSKPEIPAVALAMIALLATAVPIVLLVKYAASVLPSCVDPIVTLVAVIDAMLLIARLASTTNTLLATALPALVPTK